MDIVFLVISVVVSGADDWFHIEIFGKSQIDWFRKFAPFKNRIPSHDTFGRVFAAIDFNQLSNCFIDWTNLINQLNPDEVIAMTSTINRLLFIWFQNLHVTMG